MSRKHPILRRQDSMRISRRQAFVIMISSFGYPTTYLYFIHKNQAFFSNVRKLQSAVTLANHWPRRYSPTLPPCFLKIAACGRKKSYTAALPCLGIYERPRGRRSLLAGQKMIKEMDKLDGCDRVSEEKTEE